MGYKIIYIKSIHRYDTYVYAHLHWKILKHVECNNLNGFEGAYVYFLICTKDKYHCVMHVSREGKARIGVCIPTVFRCGHLFSQSSSSPIPPADVRQPLLRRSGLSSWLSFPPITGSLPALPARPHPSPSTSLNCGCAAGWLGPR